METCLLQSREHREVIALAFDEGNTEPLRAAPSVPEPPPPERRVEVGTTLRSRYVLEEIIGQGGDSIVFQAQDLHRASMEEVADRRVAIKVLHPHKRLDPNALTRLKREFQQVNRLAHPGIARLFDLDCDGDIWFISMERVVGQTVAAWMATSGTLEQRVDLIAAVCEALQYAHSHGIVHGDLKPSNVLVTPDGSVKLIDFGSVAGAGSRCDIPRDASAVATPSHASPQVLEGAAAEVRDDVFSLACLSYVILGKGAHPFDGMSSLGAYRSGLRPIEIPEIPAWLAKVILRGLSAERELRPASIVEFAREMMGAAKGVDAAPVSKACPSEAIPSNSHDTTVLAVSVPLAPPPLSLPSDRRAGAGNRRYELKPFQTALLGLAIMILGAGAVLLWQSTLSEVRFVSVPAQIPAPESIRLVPPVIQEVIPRATPLAEVPEVPPSIQPRPHSSGSITFDSHAMSVAEAQSMIAIPIKRLSSTREPVMVAWTIESGSAQPYVDYRPVNENVVRFIEGQTVRSIFIPLVPRNAAAAAGHRRTFVVALRKMAGGPALGPVSRITVTISPRAVSVLDEQSAQLSASER